MLATDEKKLRWLGIDLRARWRRRMAVVGTYASLLALIAIAQTSNDLWAAHPLLESLAMIVMTLILERISVFRSGLVKSFDGSSGRMIGKHRMVGSLDEWARYRYGVAGFEEASQEQQTELLRKYRVGNYLVTPKLVDDPMLDERERAERDRISRWAFRQVGWCLAIYAGVTASAKHPFPPMVTASYLWSFCILARTLPQAYVPWTEPDPRDRGELRLAEGEA